MPTPTPQAIDVIAVLARFPDGVTAEQIENEIKPPPPPKAVRYWLKMLVEKNQVGCDGPQATGRFRLLKPATAAATKTETAAPVIAPPVKAQPVPPSVPVAAPATSAPLTPPLAAGPAAAAPAAAIPVAPTPFEEQFESSVLRIVAGMSPKVTATVLLQQQAMQCFDTLNERKAFVRYGLARLDALTLEEAESYGIFPEQFEQWRPYYDQVTADGEQDDQEEQGTGDSGQAAGRAPTKARGTRVPRIPLTRGAVLREAVTLAEPLALGDVWERGMAALKSLITWRRVGIALGWGIFVCVVSQKLLMAMAARANTPQGPNKAMLTLMGPLSYLMIPAAGLAWLVFRSNDCRKTGAKLEALDYGATLIGGGMVSLVVGKVIVSIFDMVISFVG
jgi:hypothetical protein